jgi:FKBP-type peptidyl-prolyl cis-trans isomerase
VLGGCGSSSSSSDSSHSSSAANTTEASSGSGKNSGGGSEKSSGEGSEKSSGEESSGEDAGKAASEPHESVTVVKGTAKPPKVVVPSGPPPKELVIKDLKKGTLDEVKPKQRLRVNYIGVTYKTGKPFEVNWGKKPLPFIFTYGVGEVIEGWERGLKGMRVGGRRELIVPSKMAYNTGALVYVIELLQNE